MNTQTEPVVIYAGATPAIGVLISALLWRYMPDLGGELIDAIIALTPAAVAFVGGILKARGIVFSPATVEKDYVKKVTE